MQLKSAFPHILDREYPVVRPEYPLLVVLYLLRMKDVAAVPLASPGKDRAVFGFSSLAKLLALGRERFASFLSEPCENASARLHSVKIDEDFRALLEVFGKKRLGCAMVHGPGNKRSLATLEDVLDLHMAGSISTEMRLEDLAQPIFSMPGSTSIRDVIQAMFSHRYRRVFIAGEDGYVSDRTVMDYVFSPMVLDEISKDLGRDALAAPADRLEKIKPIHVGPRTTVRAAAKKLRGEWGQCLVVGGDKVITPWDVAMKPWLSGKLTIR